MTDRDADCRTCQAQEFILGGLLRSLYFDVNSTSYIKGISPSTAPVDSMQVHLVADAGDEGGVIFNSAVALSQGLWPATRAPNATLANGTTVNSPLGGYQYLISSFSVFLPAPSLANNESGVSFIVESVMPSADVSFEGWTSCPVRHSLPRGNINMRQGLPIFCVEPRHRHSTIIFEFPI